MFVCTFQQFPFFDACEPASAPGSGIVIDSAHSAREFCRLRLRDTFVGCGPCACGYVEMDSSSISISFLGKQEIVSFKTKSLKACATALLVDMTVCFSISVDRKITTDDTICDAAVGWPSEEY
jgi:hypothetical protein